MPHLWSSLLVSHLLVALGNLHWPQTWSRLDKTSNRHNRGRCSGTEMRVSLRTHRLVGRSKGHMLSVGHCILKLRASDPDHGGLLDQCLLMQLHVLAVWEHGSLHHGRARRWPLRHSTRNGHVRSCQQTVERTWERPGRIHERRSCLLCRGCIHGSRPLQAPAPQELLLPHLHLSFTAAKGGVGSLLNLCGWRSEEVGIHRTSSRSRAK